MPMLGCVCLCHTNLNSHAKPEKFTQSRDTIGVLKLLLKVNFAVLQYQLIMSAN